MDRRVVVSMLAAVLLVAGCKKNPERREPEPGGSGGDAPGRIVTLTPSATRLVIAVGGLERLVGTDKYSVEPAAVAALPKVGDFLAPNVEAIAKLEPDLVICDDVQSKAAASLQTLGIEVLSIKMHSIADIRRELGAVARALGAPETGRSVSRSIEEALAEIRERAGQREVRPRVLWVMDRQPGALSEIVAAGPGSFAAELLELIGAHNAVSGQVRYPKLSRESLIKIDADVVIDASAAAGESMEAWRDSRWRVVQASTELATPGPGIAGAVASVESLVFGSPPDRSD